MHHAGLTERDRRTVEELFVNQKIQVGIDGQNWSNNVYLLKPLCRLRDFDFLRPHGGLERFHATYIQC